MTASPYKPKKFQQW